MSVKCFRGVVSATAILVVVTSMWLRLPARAQGPGQSSVNELQTERKEVLRTRVEVYEKLVEIARSSPEELAAARNDLLDAELELASDGVGRLAVLQRKLDNSKLLEELARQRKHTGRGNEADVLLAKANRLAIEIEIGRQQK